MANFRPSLYRIIAYSEGIHIPSILGTHPPYGRHCSRHQNYSSEPNTVAVIMGLMFLRKEADSNQMSTVTYSIASGSDLWKERHNARWEDMSCPGWGGLQMACPLSRVPMGEHFREKSRGLIDGRNWQKALWTLKTAIIVKHLLRMYPHCIHIVCSWLTSSPLVVTRVL